MCKCISGTGLLPLSLGLPCTLEYEYGRGGLGAPAHGTIRCPYPASGKKGVGNMDPLCENPSSYFPPADGSLCMEAACARLSSFSESGMTLWLPFLQGVTEL